MSLWSIVSSAMLGRLESVACLVAALIVSGCTDTRTLCALGDSITYGAIGFSDARAAFPPPAALEALLARAPEEHPWRRASVRSYAVPGSWTGEWVTTPPRDQVCHVWRNRLPLVGKACEERMPLVAALGNPPCDGYLIALGINDWVGKVSVETSVDNLALLASKVGAPTWIAAPTHAKDAAIQGRGRALRNALAARGMLTGIDPPVLPLAADGVHLLDPGSAALGALWFSVLR